MATDETSRPSPTRQRTVHTLMQLPRAVPRGFRTLIARWEAYQVELRGSYSVARLQELTTAHERTSLLQVLATVLLTPIPCVVAIVLVDILPLQRPDAGWKAQGAPYWIRSFITVALITVTTLSQFCHCSPSLTLRLPTVVAFTIVLSSIMMVVFVGLHVFVGFPTPFIFQVGTWFWHPMMVASMGSQWKRIIRTNDEARKDLQRFVWCWASQHTMIFAYPVLGFIFRKLSDRNQMWFSLFLPLWKLLLKVWTNYGVFRLEDSAPVFVVFTVDVFHAMFLSCAMQSSSSTGSGALIAIMCVDVFQSCVAVHYVWVICRDLRRLGRAIELHKGSEPSQPSSVPMVSRETPLFRATWFVGLDQRIRDHPTITGSRHERQHDTSHIQAATIRSFRSGVTSHRSVISPPSVRDVMASIEPNPIVPTTPRELQKVEDLRLQYVRETLRLLHMVEYYILVEFTEVFVALVYSTYLVIMSQLPNRKFYLQLRDMTSRQWSATVHHVLLYATLELLSFGALDIALRMLLGHSPIRQLAFVLRKHWLLVQSLVVLWVYVVVQMSLQHLGEDYTLKFAWLHRASAVSLASTDGIGNSSSNGE